MRLLGLVLLDPGKVWTSSELAGRLDATAVSIHRELHRALDAGLVTREPVGRTYLYRAAIQSPLYEPLRVVLERTVGVEPELRRALDGLPGVRAAFIHGSFAKGAGTRPPRDIDVLVLGEADSRTVRRRLRSVEKRLGREIDVLAYDPDEFASLAKKGNSFARDVLRGPLTPLVGSLDMLPAA